jgi:hypothetical protein
VVGRAAEQAIQLAVHQIVLVHRRDIVVIGASAGGESSSST